MEVVVNVLNRIQGRLDQFKEMAVQAEADFVERNGYALEHELRQALFRCILCRHGQTCRKWLNSDESQREEPVFCPNAPFLKRYRRPDHRGRRAAIAA